MTENKNTKESKRKVLYVIISIIASISLWSYITYVENPDKTVVIDNIGVEYVGAEVLRENNLIVTEMDTDTLTLTFSGKRNTLTKLDGASITATVDLVDIVETYSATAGVYQLGYDLDYGGVVSQSAVSVSNTSKNYVAVTVEKLVSADIPVEVKNSVQTAEGYITEKAELDVSYIEVYGPTSEIANIDKAVLDITREDISKTISERVPVTLVDAEGTPVDTTNITMVTETVDVTIPVLMVKDIPLKVEFIETVTVKGTDAKANITPKYVTLSGAEEDFENLNEIVLGAIDLAAFGTDVTRSFVIEVPAGLKNMTEDRAALVEVTLPEFKTKTVTVNNIQTRGGGTDIYVKTSSVEVMLRGTTENLSKVSVGNVRIVADVSGVDVTAAGVRVEARVYVDDVTGIDVIGKCEVDIGLK